MVSPHQGAGVCFELLFQTFILCYSVTAESEFQVCNDTKVLELFNTFFSYKQIQFFVCKEKKSDIMLTNIAKLVCYLGFRNCVIQKLKQI